MKDNWEECVACAKNCGRCDKPLKPEDQRILSVYDHKAICMDCKHEEEKRPDYKKKSTSVIGQCMIETEVLYGDPKNYCYHHFYPYTC